MRLYRAGESGPPLLLLHGAMLDTGQGVWHDVVGQLARGYRVHVIDMPRHGGSRPWTGRLDDNFYRRFVPALLDAIGVSRVGVIGLSMGAGVAVRFALDHPDRVSALVAVGPGGIGAKRRYQFLTWAVMRVPGLLRSCSWTLARLPGYLRSALAASLTAGADTPGFERIVEHAVAEARAKSRYREKVLDDWQIYAYGPGAMRLDLTPELPTLTVPTLWVRGAGDPLVGADEFAAARARTPGSRSATIPGAGHIVTYDQPEVFVRVVREFLATVL